MGGAALTFRGVAYGSVDGALPGSGRSRGRAGALPREASVQGRTQLRIWCSLRDDKEPALGPLPHSHPLPPPRRP